MADAAITYEEFGVRLVHAAVTPERVAREVADVAGERIEIDPMAAGPGGIATASATGDIQLAGIERVDGEPLSFEARLEVGLSLVVELAGQRHRYRGQISLPLRLSVRAAEPLLLIVDVADVAPGDVDVRLTASGVRAKVLSRVGGIEDEVRRQVAKVVEERVQSDAARSARTIDVLEIVDRAWPAG